MMKWIRGLVGRSLRQPQTGDRPARPYGISASPGGCVVIVKDPQATAERGDFEAGS
jgi:hypothetical protein